MGPAGLPLALTAEEGEAFESVDWVTRINEARLSIEVFSYSTDFLPNLDYINPDVAY